MKKSFAAANSVKPSDSQMLESCVTLSGSSDAKDAIITRLQYLSDLLGDAAKLPGKPLLLWREADRSVKHVELDRQLCIGRKPETDGLVFADDKLMSRSHFAIRQEDGEFIIEDLKSNNGTTVNDPEKKVKTHILRNGDLIFAGNHIFIFLNH